MLIADLGMTGIVCGKASLLVKLRRSAAFLCGWLLVGWIPLAIDWLTFGGWVLGGWVLRSITQLAWVLCSAWCRVPVSFEIPNSGQSNSHDCVMPMTKHRHPRMAHSRIGSVRPARTLPTFSDQVWEQPGLSVPRVFHPKSALRIPLSPPNYLEGVFFDVRP